MDFELNCSPHRDLTDIIPRLFNMNKLADVKFIVDDQTIWAHSLVLMGRSEVFEEQMEASCGAKKLVPVNGYKYDSFLEFMRYIYTDECEINDNNGLDLLKLAVKYRVIKLENQVLKTLMSDNWDLQLFNYVVVDKYEIARNNSLNTISCFYKSYLANKDFLQLHPDALNEFLKLDKIQKGVTEMQIFKAMANWINSYCVTHHISLAEARQKFDKQIRNIRFATMLQDELWECTEILPGLLNDSDLASISKQVVFDCGEKLWSSKCREEYVPLYYFVEFASETVFKTTLTVCRPTVLYGLCIGIEHQRKAIEIEISNENRNQIITFTQNAPTKMWHNLQISLGESIILKPRMRYTIQIKYLAMTYSIIKVRCRKKNTNVIINDPNNSVQITEASANMEEMCFKSPAK